MNRRASDARPPEGATPGSSLSSDVPEARLVSFGGAPHRLRPLTLADADRLIAFFQSHNEETVRLRYGYFFREMTPSRARQLVGVDQHKDLALGIFSTGPDGTEVVDAIGRYCLMEDGKTAEMAFIVRESKRRLGMAQTLLHALMDIARKRGLNELVAQVQRENRGMIALFQQAGASSRSVLVADALDVRLPLHPSAT